MERANPTETWDCLKAQLSHQQMLALARAVERWIARSPSTADGLAAWADRLRRVADEVGPDWDPPVPAEQTASRFLAEMTLRLEAVHDPERRRESRVQLDPILGGNGSDRA